MFCLQNVKMAAPHFQQHNHVTACATPSWGEMAWQNQEIYLKTTGDEILGINKWNRWPSVYSYEERMRAVTLYTQYDKSFVAVRQELGYPSHRPRIICITQFKANTTAREYVQREDRRAKSRPPELHLSALIHACERFRLMPLCGGTFPRPFFFASRVDTGMQARRGDPAGLLF